VIYKVLIAIPCLKRGGTEMQTLNLSQALLSCGHEVEIICYFEYDNSMVQEFKKSGAMVTLLNLNRNLGYLQFIKRLQNEIRFIKPYVVHIQYMAPGALPIIASRLAGVKRIFATVHQPCTQSHRKFSKLILRIASLLCTRFIAVSVNAEKSWFGNGQLFDEKKPVKLQSHHFTIYNSVDVKKIQKISSAVNSENLKRELAIQSVIPIIGVVSRLRHEKGIDLLIDAFRLLRQSNDYTHLLVVGTGPDEAKLKEMVHKNNLNSHVTFYGEADWEKAMQLMAIMDVVVVPSRFEGFGLTAAEAMAAGKPVVASDVFVLKEVVIHNKTGFLFPIENSALLHEHLKRLCNDQNMRQMLGDNGQKRADIVFGMDLFRRKVSALYNQI